MFSRERLPHMRGPKPRAIGTNKSIIYYSLFTYKGMFVIKKMTLIKFKSFK